MEKEPQLESMATVNMKPEYAPSEAFSASEPPPAYHKSRSTSVQIARIIAVTVVVCSIILGSFLLASAYVNANSSCRQLEQELELLGEAADRFQPPPLQPEALIQEEPLPSKRHSDHYPTEAPPKTAKELDSNAVDDDEDDNTSENSSSEEPDAHPRMPVAMEMDDLVASLLAKNQKSKMNCVVEKRKAEEFVDHQPKTVRLPFGINLTTNPRFEKISGERMVIVCESGSMQRAQPPPQQQQQEEEEDEDEGRVEDTIMIQPVMIPIPQTPFRTHMPQQQMPPAMAQAPEPGRPLSPAHMLAIEGMRPPMMQPQVQRISRIQIQARPQIMEEPQMQVQQMPPQMQQPGEFPPNPVLRHIVQQIIAQKIMESQRAREMQMREEQQQQQQQQQPQVEMEEERPHRFQMAPQNMIGQRIPIPEEILTQLNRLPNRDVIVAVQESEPSTEDEGDQPAQQEQQQQQEMRFVQEQRQNAAEMNGRQTFATARGLSPIDLPVAVMGRPQGQEEGGQQQQPMAAAAAASDEARPHFVQPRSV